MREGKKKYPNNLSSQLTSFIGREREIEAVQRLLAGVHTDNSETFHPSPGREPGPARLVTLTGVGGCGKTRLALEIAAAYCRPDRPGNRYPDGVWLIEFAPLTNPDRVAQMVISALKLREKPQLSLVKTLVQAFKTKKMLLIFDNCEHLAVDIARLAENLLQNCPDLTILATSRAPLNFPGELVFAVPPLEFINPNEHMPLTNLVQCEAVRLFVDRAKAVQPQFVMTEPQARAVIDICRQLDGVPLAIELAAARIKMMPPQQIVRRLEESLRLLRNTGPRTIERHQNLQAAFDWSHALLSEAEQVLFRRLSVFAGGWTLTQAEEIAGFAPLTTMDVLPWHERLLDQSFIMRMDDGEGERARYRLLEPVRQYAAGKLEVTSEGKELADRHLASLTRLSAAAWVGLRTAEEFAWLNRVEAEIGNIRAALEWSQIGGDISQGMNIAINLFHFWLARNHLIESLEIMEGLLAHASMAKPSRLRAKGLAFLSLSYLRRGDYQPALAAAEEALAIETRFPDVEIRGYALAGKGHALALHGDLEMAITVLEKSLISFQHLEDISGQGWTLSRLGTVALMMGDMDRAESWLAEMADKMRAIGNTHYLPYALRYWGYALVHKGDYRGALPLFREILTGWEAANIHLASIMAVAMVALVHGQVEYTARLMGAIKREVQEQHMVFLPYDQEQYAQAVAMLEAYFENPKVVAAWERGFELTVAEAVQEALALCDSLSSSIVESVYPAGLTPREIEVLGLVEQGLTNQQIADQLVISRRTVHAHLRSIYQKLEVNNRTTAVRKAALLHLV